MSLQMHLESQAAGKHLFITECPWQSLLCAGDLCTMLLLFGSHFTLIFPPPLDDIFSSSQVKIPTPKSRSSQAASEAKAESKTLSTFDDPLNAFGGQ